MARSLIILTVGGIIVTLVTVTGIQVTEADIINPGVFPIDSNPYGLSYADWSAKWWQWAFGIPSTINPIGDSTGKNCAVHQNGPVWFLAGTFGGSAVRTCNVPAGKAILVFDVGGECSTAEYPKLTTESELLNCVIAGNQNMAGFLSIDGVPIKNLGAYRITSTLFNMTLPANNSPNVRAGSTPAVSDGLWIMLKPLSSGNHDIHFTGTIFDLTTGNQAFSNDVTYHLTIK